MEFPYPGSSAISLCFDGGHPEHVELVWPLLEGAGIRATFFVTAPALLRDPGPWREIASAGHEIGTHSHYGVSIEGTLRGWSLKAVQEDLIETDRAIYEIANMLARSFAYDGPNHTCEAGGYETIVRHRYLAVRGTEFGHNLLDNVDLGQTKCFAWRHFAHDLSEVLPTDGYWSVPVFDRFFSMDFQNAEHDLRTLADLVAKVDGTHVAPFGEIANCIATNRTKVNE